MSGAETRYLLGKLTGAGTENSDLTKQGKLTVIVQYELSLWIKKREQLIRYIRKKMEPLTEQSGAGFTLELIFDSAIHDVVHGINPSDAALTRVMALTRVTLPSLN